VPLWCTPGSEQIHQTIIRDGQLGELEAIGATVLANACGPCIGQWKRDDVEKGERNAILTSFNRNFPRRNDGNPETLAFIGSPEIVIAYALSGSLAFDPQADEIEGADGSRFRLAPPEKREQVELQVAPDSDRLQLLDPFPAWGDVAELRDLPLLLKARGKCTTDHISPAGPWLRYRGHLDRISDNMFTGAVNAFSGETGESLDQLTGERGPTPQVARHYKADGLHWVVVGDDNYGEGSSREHAAMSPRFLGAAAVIVRSFARIHETNLKKQGVLPLVFDDPADYEKVQETDRVSILGLDGLAPGTPLEVVFHHEDGREDRCRVHHTLNEDQVGGFRAGSALNVLRTG